MVHVILIQFLRAVGAQAALLGKQILYFFGGVLAFAVQFLRAPFVAGNLDRPTSFFRIESKPLFLVGSVCFWIFKSPLSFLSPSPLSVFRNPLPNSCALFFSILNQVLGLVFFCAWLARAVVADFLSGVPMKFIKWFVFSTNAAFLGNMLVSHEGLCSGRVIRGRVFQHSFPIIYRGASWR